MIVIRRWSADRLCILLPFGIETTDYIREIIVECGIHKKEFGLFLIEKKQFVG